MNTKVVSYRHLKAGRGYYVELHQSAYEAGWNDDSAQLLLKVCIMPPAYGAKQPLPSDVGAANYQWQDLSTGADYALAYGTSGEAEGRLHELICAPGYSLSSTTPEGTIKNVSRITELSAGWAGAHLISPVPLSLFRSTYSPTAEEEVIAANYTYDPTACGAGMDLGSNTMECDAGGVGYWGGTCTCPDGRVFGVGDVGPRHEDGTQWLACYGGVQSAVVYTSPGAHSNVRVTCAGNKVEFGMPGLRWDIGGNCTCPDGRVYPVSQRWPDSGDDPATLACINGTAGPVEQRGFVRGIANSRQTGHRGTQVTCDISFAPSAPPPSPPILQPPSPSPGSPPSPPCSTCTMWGAVQSSGAAAVTDGAVASGTVSGAGIFWGFRGSEGGADPDFGSNCGGAEQRIGTPCAPGVAPSKRYNLLLVRAGPAAQAGRVGLSQRSWLLAEDSEFAALYSAAGLPQKPVQPTGWDRDSQGNWQTNAPKTLAPQLWGTMLHAAYPLHSNPALLSAPPTSTPEPYVPSNWQGASKYMQVASGYFVPPVTGLYQFSVWGRVDGLGDAYVMLSPSADPAGGYFVALGASWSSQKVSRWLSLEKGRYYYYEFWMDFLSERLWNAGSAVAAVRLATTDAAGDAIQIPASVKSLGYFESEAGADATCKASGSAPHCYWRGSGTPEFKEGTYHNAGQRHWSLFDDSNGGLDWMWKENYFFDPIPSVFLRHSGKATRPPKPHQGGRGALRKWWGWSTCAFNKSARTTQPLDDAWSFPWAMWPGAEEPSLKNASLAPNGTEVISEIFTPRGIYLTGDMKGLACYAETITAYFRPKRTAAYQFKLWSDDEYFGRMYFNPQGDDPTGAVEVAASRGTRFADLDLPWDNWHEGCQACAKRARSDWFELQEGKLYFMRIYHPASYQRGDNKWSGLKLQLVLKPGNATGTWGLLTPPVYSRGQPCSPSSGSGDEIVVDVVDDSWLVAPHEAPQVALSIGETVARCSAGAEGCKVPELATSPATRPLERRQLERGSERRERHGEQMRRRAEEAATLPAAPEGADEDGEDDDHVKFHEEAAELPSLDELVAVAPFGGAAAPISQLRAEWSAAAAHGRRLESSSPLRWSSPSTWGSTWDGSVFNGSICFIPNGTHVLLDVPAVYVRIWVIEGTLTLADELDISLGAEAIIINHGELHVGSAATPFSHSVNITLQVFCNSLCGRYFFDFFGENEHPGIR